MDLRINDRIVLQPGRFYAIVAPVELFLAGLNDNPVLGKYTTILISGNFSRLLDGVKQEIWQFRSAASVHGASTTDDLTGRISQHSHG